MVYYFRSRVESVCEIRTLQTINNSGFDLRAIKFDFFGLGLRNLVQKNATSPELDSGFDKRWFWETGKSVKPPDESLELKKRPLHQHNSPF